MRKSRGGKAARVILSFLLIAVLLLRLLFLFFSLKLRSYYRSRRFYRALRASGLDKVTARRFLGTYRKHNVLSLRRIISMASGGRVFSSGAANHKPY